MDSTERILGKLEAHHESIKSEFKSFRDQVAADISGLKIEIKDLQSFKWKVLGAVSLAVFVISKVKL